METVSSSKPDRRKQPRRRVLLTGKLAFPDQNTTGDCAVRNLSETGALITSRDFCLPDNPFLIVVKYGELHSARTAWRDGERSGLEFLKSWRFNDDGADRMRRLWSAVLG